MSQNGNSDSGFTTPSSLYSPSNFSSSSPTMFPPTPHPSSRAPWSQGNLSSLRGSNGSSSSTSSILSNVLTDQQQVSQPALQAQRQDAEGRFSRMRNVSLSGGIGGGGGSPSQGGGGPRQGSLEQESSYSSRPSPSPGFISGTPHLLAAMQAATSTSHSIPRNTYPSPQEYGSPLLPSLMKEENSFQGPFLPFLANENSTGPLIRPMKMNPAVNPAAVQVAPALSFVSSMGGGGPGPELRRQISYVPTSASSAISFGLSPSKTLGGGVQFMNPSMSGGRHREIMHQMSVPLTRGGGLGGPMPGPAASSSYYSSQSLNYGERISNGGGGRPLLAPRIDPWQNMALE